VLAMQEVAGLVGEESGNRCGVGRRVEVGEL